MGRTCFCPGCKTGYQSDMRERKKRGEKNPSIFTTPQDPALFRLWQKAIPRADRLLRRSDSVCIKHFKKEDVTYQTEPLKLFDGSVYVQELAKPRLRKGAVPSIFDQVPGHSTYVQKMKSGDKSTKLRKQKRSAATKQFMTHKALSNSFGTEITETKKHIPSKEKENVLKTDISLLPQIILNCLTSEPHTVLTTLNKSIAKNNFSSESNNLQFGVKHSTLEGNDVPSNQTKVPERISLHSTKSSLLTNSKVISSQSNLKSVFAVPQESFQSPNFTKDFSTNSQEIVQPSVSQNNLIHSEVRHKQSSCQDDSTTEDIVQPSHSQRNLRHSEVNHKQSSCQDGSTNEPCAINQPSSPMDMLTAESDIIPEPSNNQSNSTSESEHFRESSLTVTAATEVAHQHSDTSFTGLENSSLLDSEIGVDLPLSVAKKKLCFNFLKDNAHTINKMNSWWTVNTFDNFIICARWNLDCLVERKIVIYEDLKIKVFLKEKETILGNGLEAKSIETISHLIFKVERLRICKNILKGAENCSGFLQAHFMCRRRDSCLNCIEWENKKLEERKQLKKQKLHNQVELIRFYMSN